MNIVDVVASRAMLYGTYSNEVDEPVIPRVPNTSVPFLAFAAQ